LDAAWSKRYPLAGVAIDGCAKIPSPFKKTAAMTPDQQQGSHRQNCKQDLVSLHRRKSLRRSYASFVRAGEPFTISSFGIDFVPAKYQAFFQGLDVASGLGQRNQAHRWIARQRGLAPCMQSQISLKPAKCRIQNGGLGIAASSLSSRNEEKPIARRYDRPAASSARPAAP
jgi:hypothetical protein